MVKILSDSLTYLWKSSKIRYLLNFFWTVSEQRNSKFLQPSWWYNFLCYLWKISGCVLFVRKRKNGRIDSLNRTSMFWCRYIAKIYCITPFLGPCWSKGYFLIGYSPIMVRENNILLGKKSLENSIISRLKSQGKSGNYFLKKL